MKFNRVIYIITSIALLISLYFITISLIERNKLSNIEKLFSTEQKYKIKKYFFPYKLIKEHEDHINKLNKDVDKFNNYSGVYLIQEIKIKESLEDLKFNYLSSNIKKIWNKEFKIKIYKNNLQLLHGINNVFPGSAFLDFGNDNLYIISATGIIGQSKIIADDKIIFKQIENNISNFINENQFKKGNWYSVKDLLIVNNKIYVSYTDEIYEDCWATSLLEGKLNDNYINFKRIFRPDLCAHITDNPDKDFNAHQSGGKIISLDDYNLLFSHGDYRHRQLSQNINSVFGKILKINLSNKNYKIISMGHRNPQGLLLDKNKEIILSTEHGPDGGDEINLIPNTFNTIKNYGWPVSSYGEHYKGKIKANESKYKKYPLFKSHSDHGFEEPLKYFTPSIGISEIIKFEEDSYIATSLKDKSIYAFKLDNNNILKDLERIEVGERIRDIIYKNNQIILFLEDSASIAIIEF